MSTEFPSTAVLDALKKHGRFMVTDGDLMWTVQALIEEARADGERRGIERAAEVCVARIIRCNNNIAKATDDDGDVSNPEYVRNMESRARAYANVRDEIRALAARPALVVAPEPRILGPWGSVDDGSGRPGVSGDVRCMRFGVSSHINGPAVAAGVGLYGLNGRLIASRSLADLDRDGWPREAMADRWAASLGCGFTDAPVAATAGGDHGR